MFLEERVEQLEKQVEFLTKLLQSNRNSEKPEEYVTPKQLAKKLNRSTNTIYIRIRTGEIQSIKKAGGILIPMSQFNTSEEAMKQKPKKELGMKEKIFR